jgi:hypothetical protein
MSAIRFNPLVKPRTPCVTVDWLRRWRPLWTPTPGGFLVLFSYRFADGREAKESVRINAQPRSLGGLAYFLVCPECGHQRRMLYAAQRLACRQCAGLRYVAASLRDPWKLHSHFCDLLEARDHRPGRKPRRYDRDWWNACRHEFRAIRQFCAAADRIGARTRRR